MEDKMIHSAGRKDFRPPKTPANLLQTKRHEKKRSPLQDAHLKNLALQQIGSMQNRTGPLDIEKNKSYESTRKIKYSFKRLKQKFGKQHNGGLIKIINSSSSPPSEIRGHSDLVSYLLKNPSIHYNKSEHSPMGKDGQISEILCGPKVDQNIASILNGTLNISEFPTII